MSIPNETVMENAKNATKKRAAEVAQHDKLEKKLEEGLEESMAGSDPVAVTQPARSPQDKRDERRALEPKE
jgi:hypothetical protein